MYKVLSVDGLHYVEATSFTIISRHSGHSAEKVWDIVYGNSRLGTYSTCERAKEVLTELLRHRYFDSQLDYSTLPNV